MKMTEYLKFQPLFWNQKDFWFQLKFLKTQFNCFRILVNAGSIRTITCFAGAEECDYDIKGRSAPAGNRGSDLIAVCYSRLVVDSTLAHSAIDLNNYARCYV